MTLLIERMRKMNKVYIAMTDHEALYDEYDFGIAGVYTKETLALRKVNQLNSRYTGNHVFFVVPEDLKERP